MTVARTILALALTAFGPTALSAQSTDILLNCSACHAVAPERPTTQVFPDLNGQPIRYLERQLEAFREGDRRHRQMELTALALGQGDGAMARLYADAPRPVLEPKGMNDDTPPALVTQGDWSRGLAPCASCHSLDPDTDRARTAPRLHGQPEAYLADQLRAYADGRRTSDPMGRMRAYSARLDTAEISDLAAYYASWRPETEEAKND
ncbi:c-type cytochrome [Maritimibacter sp. UBA3975]|uniref:c-type cytochrome n=1 Tax=Maritimibacter sp. UBA3975 TaxID=1946833 RepID=UPI000C0B501E|nr:c-type cytochrome [Maritimibacter sp. UBA3975]MAM63002.1 hypothetical protein [Maritimibacter sp.]|tara:strand:- start:7340 stop:7960 length:621 start_codon:yes stop_codon:yes gene_type:complete